jgi:hypothetical protein
VRRPGAPAGQQAQQVQQQVVNTQDIILVRQPVLVPYVRSTTFGTTALSGVQQTQVVNALGVTAAGAAATELTGAAAQSATGSAAAQIEEVRAQYEQRLAGYERRIDELNQKITELLKRIPAP